MQNQTLDNAEREIEISIEQAQGAVDKKNDMNALIALPAFTRLFTVGYMEQESARLVSLLADQEWQGKEKQEALVNDMRAISSLRQYIMGVKAFGNQMERQILASRAQLDEMEAELEEGE